MRLLAKAAAVLLAAGAGLIAAPASAQKSADTLRAMWLDPVVNIDPYYNSQRTGLILAHHAWDGLVFRDPNGFVMKPLLAESWKWIDETTVEFVLRKGVKFQNGDPFSAADVAYTVKVITDPASGVSVPSNFNWIAGLEVVDDHTVRLKLKQAFPAALEFVSFVMPIYPQAYREKVGKDEYNKNPIGTGPYRISKWTAGADIYLDRFDGYYEGGGKGRPPIGHIVIKQVTDATAMTNNLLGGQVDWIWQFPADLVDKLAAMPNLSALRQEAFRIAFLHPDAAGRSDPKNPWTNVLVRRAMAYAVDRQTFAKQLVQGGARVPDAPCYFTQFGCDQSAAVHYDYDPAKAKALLAEAGYPNGFDTEIVRPDAILTSWVGSVQSYLAAVGIRAKVSTMMGAAATVRIEKGEVPLYISSWGSYSINDVSAIMPYFFSSNVDDQSQDHEVTGLLKQAGSIGDPEMRKKLYAQAIHRITDQAFWLPLSTYVTVYGFTRQLEFKAYPDEMPRFFWAKWQ